MAERGNIPEDIDNPDNIEAPMVEDGPPDLERNNPVQGGGNSPRTPRRSFEALHVLHDAGIHVKHKESKQRIRQINEKLRKSWKTLFTDEVVPNSPCGSSEGSSLVNVRNTGSDVSSQESAEQQEDDIHDVNMRVTPTTSFVKDTGEDASQKTSNLEAPTSPVESDDIQNK